MDTKSCGCLSRPEEPLAIQFLSTRYFTGTTVVDVFDSPEGVDHWLRTHASKALAPDMVPNVLADAATFARIREGRQAVGALLRAATDVGTPDPDALDGVNHQLRKLREPRLVWVEPSRGQLTWAKANSAVDTLLGTVFLSALDTVTYPRVERLRSCPAPRCILYYTLQHSKQLWCSGTCGNRARVARHSRRRPEQQ